MTETRALRTEPRRVTYFASGSNHAGEILGFSDVGMNPGVAVNELDRKGNSEAALKSLAGSNARVFVDSGAFAEVKVNLRNQKTGEFPRPELPEGAIFTFAEISDEEWNRRLDTYSRLADALGNQLYVVAPDKIADQDETLRRLRKYADRVHEIAAKGANILVPIQKGSRSMAEFDEAVSEILDVDYIPAIPMKKDATSVDDLAEFLSEDRCERVHLLGLGATSPKFPEVAEMFGKTSPWTEVFCDSVRIRAIVGQGRPLTEAQKRYPGKGYEAVVNRKRNAINDVFGPGGPLANESAAVEIPAAA